MDENVERGRDSESVSEKRKGGMTVTALQWRGVEQEVEGRKDSESVREKRKGGMTGGRKVKALERGSGEKIGKEAGGGTEKRTDVELERANLSPFCVQS